MAVSATAASSGGSSAGQATLSPVPTTTGTRAWAGGSRQPADTLAPAGQSASARIPASLRSSTTRSLGHFSRASTPVASATASASATATAIVTAPATGAGGRNSTDTSSALPGGATQLRARRPRPAVWWSATTTIPSPAPSRARPSASLLVDPVSAHQRTSANRLPASAARTAAAQAPRIWHRHPPSP